MEGEKGEICRIHPRVHQAIEAEIARWPDVETGGVLIGRFSAAANIFQIVDLINAPPDSRRSREEFTLGTEGLKRRIAEIVTATNGALMAVGTWHSHLVPHGASQRDLLTGIGMAARQSGPVLMLIHTSGGYRALVVEDLSAPELEVEER